MKLDKLRMLRDELVGEFGSEWVAATIYYHFGGKWNQLDNATPVADSVAHCLDKAEVEQIAYHAASSRVAWFKCPSMHCTVSLEFPTSPQLTKRKRSRARISSVLQ